MNIMDIARELAELEAQHRHFDGASVRPGASTAARKAARAAADRVDDRAEALRRELDMLPAATLTEAVVQLRQAAHLAGLLHMLELPHEESAAYGRRLERLVLSALPHVAAAAGVDLAAMDWGDALRVRAERFGELVRDAGGPGGVR